jgi:uncharacterized protein YqhQ
MGTKEKVAIGGQAVMEGVMILSPSCYAVSVRKPNKSIKTKVTTIKKANVKWKQLPFIRGSINLVRMLSIGMKALAWSANETAEKEEEKISKKEMTLTIITSLLLAIGIFVFIPYILTEWIGFKEIEKPFLFNLIDGIIRIAFFIAYVWAISFMDDIKRMFQYHGAEHMAIHCYEHNQKLTTNNVKKFTTLHPRCGTAFILIVLIVAILVFSIIPSVVIWLFPTFTALNFWVMKAILFVIRLSFLPVVAGVAYEILKASDKYKGNIILKIFSAPGLWLQKITTQPPSKDQIEVAIASVKAALKNS